MRLVVVVMVVVMDGFGVARMGRGVYWLSSTRETRLPVFPLYAVWRFGFSSLRAIKFVQSRGKSTSSCRLHLTPSS
jgi:hypothetical protein